MSDDLAAMPHIFEVPENTMAVILLRADHEREVMNIDLHVPADVPNDVLAHYLRAAADDLEAGKFDETDNRGTPDL